MKFKNLKYILLSVLISLAFTSCTKIIGYSVVLWGDDINQLTDGELVKVYVKSNITHTYIIENPNYFKNIKDVSVNEKIEIPLWQISEPLPKNKALKNAQRYAEYANTFAYVKLDGLPIRADAINTAKQVYKLRKGEIIRVLYKGEGAAVTNGKSNMKGDWYRVLTSAGTQGWCFSYNLDIYESENGGKREQIVETNTEDNLAEDKNLQILKSKTWHPGEYRQLIKKNKIDLQVMNLNYGFTFNEEEMTINLSTVNDEHTWKFNKIKKLTSKQYQFDGANVNVTIRSEDEIIVQFLENGKPKNVIFSSFDTDISEIINKEITRRNSEIEKIINFSKQYSSANYGKLSIYGSNGNYNIFWQNFKLLVPAIIESSVKGQGTVSIEYLLSDSLKANYDGVLTIQFADSKKENNFLYKLTDSGLRLEDVTSANIKDNVLTKRSSTPTIIFLSKE